jgi:hypothetical protein
MKGSQGTLRRAIPWVAAVLLLGALALVAWGFVAKRRADEARASQAAAVAALPAHARVARGDDASRDDRLAAGRRVVDDAGKLFAIEWKTSSSGAPYFVATAKIPSEIADAWTRAIATATDERLPEPSPDVRAWVAEHAPELRALAAQIASGPMPEWEQDVRWDVAREARLAEILARHAEMLAAIDARSGANADAETLLDAAWSLRAGISRLLPSSLGDETMLGALRCTRARDAAEWVRRLDSVNARAEDSAGGLHVANERLEGARETWMPRWIIPPVSTVMRLPAELTAAMTSDMATDFASRLESLDRCDPPTRAIVPGWEHDRRLAQWLPPSADLEVADRLVATEEREIALRLTRAVVRSRAGLEPGDPCGSVTMTTEPDGRLMLHWVPEPHPLTDDATLRALRVLRAPREFTFDAPR